MLSKKFANQPCFVVVTETFNVRVEGFKILLNQCSESYNTSINLIVPFASANLLSTILLVESSAKIVSGKNRSIQIPCPTEQFCFTIQLEGLKMCYIFVLDFLLSSVVFLGLELHSRSLKRLVFTRPIRSELHYFVILLAVILIALFLPVLLISPGDHHVIIACFRNCPKLTTL